jgi:hypothetical protein
VNAGEALDAVEARASDPALGVIRDPWGRVRRMQLIGSAADVPSDFGGFGLLPLFELVLAGHLVPRLEVEDSALLLRAFDDVPLGSIPDLRDKRRQKVEGCTCDVDGMHPPHDAAARCESGWRPHCTCDWCF